MKQALESLQRPLPLLALLIATALVQAACSNAPEGLRAQGSAHATAQERAIASVALASVGGEYADYMAGPKRFDNAGLAYYAYRQNGRALPRSLDDQLNAGLPVPIEKALPGDLAFFRLDSPDGKGRLYVGVLVDAQHVVLAIPGGVKKISLSDTHWSQRLVGASHISPRQTPT